MTRNRYRAEEGRGPGRPIGEQGVAAEGAAGEVRLLEVARDPRTSTTWLGGLAMRSLALAKAVAGNPATTVRILRCIARRWKEAQAEVARHPALERSLASQLAWTQPEALFGNPSLPPRIAGRRSLPNRVLCHLAAHEAAAEWLWPALAGHVHPRVREVAARAVGAPAAVIAALSHDESVRVRAAAAAHPALPPEEQGRLARDVDEVRGALARRGELTAEVEELLARDPGYRVRMGVAANGRQGEVLAALARDEDQSVRAEAAFNAATPSAAMLELAGDDDPLVRLMVAKNPQAPEDVMVRLLEYPSDPILNRIPDVMVLAAALDHARAPLAQLHRLASSPDPDDRRCAAGCRRAPRELVMRLARDRSEEVREAAAGNPAWDPESDDLAARLEVQLARDPSPSIRREIARRSHAPELLAKLAADVSPGVRREVAESKHAPPKALVRLAKDAEEEVRERVARNPAAPVAALLRLLRDGSSAIRRTAAMSPTLPLDELLAVARSCRDPDLQHGLVSRLGALDPSDPAFARAAAQRSEAIDVALAGCRQLPAAIADALASSRSLDVRSALAGHTPDAGRLARLAGDPDAAVRRRVAARLGELPMPEVARRLAADPDVDVRVEAARSTTDVGVIDQPRRSRR